MTGRELCLNEFRRQYEELKRKSQYKWPDEFKAEAVYIDQDGSWLCLILSHECEEAIIWRDHALGDLSDELTVCKIFTNRVFEHPYIVYRRTFVTLDKFVETLKIKSYGNSSNRIQSREKRKVRH